MVMAANIHGDSFLECTRYNQDHLTSRGKQSLTHIISNY